MDMFTDVDMFADILDAAMRNVAVYILLDKQNAHHFFSMVSNCRVNLQNIQVSAYSLKKINSNNKTEKAAYTFKFH